MKRSKLLLVALFFCLMTGSTAITKAQCAMCSTTVESNSKSGAGTTKGLNNGILFLLAAPYLLVAVGGYIWYKKYRGKNVAIAGTQDI